MEFVIGLLVVMGVIALLRSLFSPPAPPINYYFVPTTFDDQRRVSILPILVFLSLAALVLLNYLNR